MKLMNRRLSLRQPAIDQKEVVIRKEKGSDHVETVRDRVRHQQSGDQVACRATRRKLRRFARSSRAVCFLLAGQSQTPFRSRGVFVFIFFSIKLEMKKAKK